MCLAIPGQIISIDGSGLERSGEVRFGGVTQAVALGYVPEAQLGDYVIVHAGCAISLLDEEAAKESLADYESWKGQFR